MESKISVPALQSKVYQDMADNLLQIAKDLKHKGDIEGIAIRYFDRVTTHLRRFEDQAAYKAIADQLSTAAENESKSFKALITPELIASDKVIWDKYLADVEEEKKAQQTQQPKQDV